jgi:hypothetical protein
LLKTQILAKFLGKDPDNGASVMGSTIADGTGSASAIGVGAGVAMEVAARAPRLVRRVEKCIVALLGREALS